MAQDKRGRPPEPDMDEVLDEMQAEEGGQDFVAGPTQRNEVGNTKRAAAKASGTMGATKKLDPELDIAHVDDGRVKSGSSAGIRPFKDVPPDKGAKDVSVTLSNAEIAESVPTTALKSPARTAARTENAAADRTTRAGIAPDSGRQRVPAPGNAVTAPKGTFVRGHPTAAQAGGRSQSSSGDANPKQSARRSASQAKRPLDSGSQGR